MNLSQTLPILKGASHAAYQADTARTLSGKIYPNGAFSVGTVPRKSKAALEKRFDRLGLAAGVPTPVYGITESGSLQVEGQGPNPFQEATLEKVNPLSLSPVRNRGNDEKPPRIHGNKGITRHGRNMVECAAERLEKTYGRKRISFVTLTCPSLTVEEELQVTAQWGEMVKKFWDWLSYAARIDGQQFEYVSVTECQELRRASTGEIGLHLHGVFVGRKYAHGAFLVTPNQVREAWRRILHSVIQRSLASEYISVGLELVRASSAGYLAKYMSKGGTSLSQAGRNGITLTLPKKWWNISRQLSARVRAGITNLSQAACQSVWNAVESGVCQPFMRWARVCDRPGVTETAPRIICGVIGKAGQLLSEQWRAQTKESLAQYL